MIGSYIGIAVAFGFAVSVPGRAIPRLLAEDLPTAMFVAALVVLSVGVVFISLWRGGRSLNPSESKGPAAPLAERDAGHAAEAAAKVDG
jgi:hypothetical protein